MAKPKTNKDGYQAVIAALEKQGHKSPQSALARILGFRGRQAVNNWKGEVPPAHAFKVSLITGVPIDHILPETVIEVQKLMKEMRT